MSIFISYAREDGHFAQMLYLLLKQEGFDVWIDQDNLGIGRWKPPLEQEISKRTHMLVVLSPDALSSTWVKKEYSLAIKKRKELIPVIYRVCDTPPVLEDYQYYDFTAPMAIVSKYHELIADIAQAIPRKFINHYEQQRQRDRKLLEELLRYINFDTFDSVTFEVGRYLPVNIYEDTFTSYRASRESGQNWFIDTELEGSFADFDRCLAQFDRLLLINCVQVDINGTKMYVPRLRLPEFRPDMSLYSIAEANRLVDKFEEVLNYLETKLVPTHRALMKVIIQKFPNVRTGIES